LRIESRKAGEGIKEAVSKVNLIVILIPPMAERNIVNQIDGLR
jgi:hypothetical protein